MNATSTHEVTRLLTAYQNGDESALEKIFPLVYQELRRIASGYLHGESRLETIQTTDLVHEAYLRLVDESQLSFENRLHFFVVAARAMRQFLVYYAKRKKAAKRGGGQKALSLEEAVVIGEQKSRQLLDLDEALNRLTEMDPRAARIVELRYFTGMTIEETGRIMGLSPATVKRDWTAAKAWLYNELKREQGEE